MYERLELLRTATPTAMTVPETRALVTDEIRARLKERGGDRRAEAIRAIDQLRLAAFTPSLMEALEDSSFTAVMAYTALVKL